jgi:hypothetical protein
MPDTPLTLFFAQANFGQGARFSDGDAAMASLDDELAALGIAAPRFMQNEECVTAVWKMDREWCEGSDRAEMSMLLGELFAPNWVVPEDARLPYGFLQTVGETDSNELWRAVYEAVRCKRADDAKYLHLVESLAFAAIEVLTVDDVMRLNGVSQETIDDALAHLPTTMLVDAEVVRMKMDNRAARAMAGLLQFQAVEKLGLILHDPDATPANKIAVLNALRDTAGAKILPPTNATAIRGRSLPVYNFDIVPRTAGIPAKQ